MASPGSGARPSRRPRWLYAALGALVLLHHDVWNWHQPRLVLGLPVALVWHVGLSVAAAGVMALLLHRTWPLSPPPGEGDGGRH